MKRVEIQNLRKTYRLLHRTERPNDTLRDALSWMGRHPVRALRSLTRGRTHETISPLDDISFEVLEGDVLGIVGRNGAGKSTLLKVLSRITPPTSGRVVLRGRVASLLEVGTGFHPELTGRENIFVNGAVLGLKKAEIQRRFDDIVQFAGIETFLDTPVKRYSSGMQVRLAFAVAAHLEAEILLVDEVLAVGDAEFQKRCLGRMKEITRQGRTVLFVSHNLNAVEELCRSAVWIDNGRLRAWSGDVRSVLSEYLGSTGESTEEPSSWLDDGRLRQNEWLQFERVAILGSDGRPVSGPIRNDECAVFRVEGEVRRQEANLAVGAAVYDEGGHLVFWTFTLDGPAVSRPELGPGRFAVEVEIPQRLLNEGVYRVEALASLVNTRWLFGPGEGPGVAFAIRGGLSDSEYWYWKRPGLLAPVFSWKPVSKPGLASGTEANAPRGRNLDKC